MISIKDIILKLKRIAQQHPNIHHFGCGLNSMIDSQQIDTFPYLFVVLDEGYLMPYTRENKYRAIEYSMTLRVGDKINDQKGYNDLDGLGGDDNQLDIVNNTFIYIKEIINIISENFLNDFDDIRLVDNINIDMFFDEDESKVTGNEAVITFRVKNDKVCISPLTD